MEVSKYRPTLKSVSLLVLFDDSNEYGLSKGQGARLACRSELGHSDSIPEVVPWTTNLPPMKAGVIRPYFKEIAKSISIIFHYY
jgi:hypothetical protein